MEHGTSGEEEARVVLFDRRRGQEGSARTNDSRLGYISVSGCLIAVIVSYLSPMFLY